MEKTYITPKLRAVIREQLQHVTYTATSEHHVENARVMTALSRVLVANITDEEIDRVILEVYGEGL